MQTTINEYLIREVCISDGTCITGLIKHNPNDMEYQMSINYADLQPDEKCCIACGHRYHPTEEYEHCPLCNEEIPTLSADDIDEYIYDALQNGCTVTMQVFDGRTFRFELNENQ